MVNSYSYQFEKNQYGLSDFDYQRFKNPICRSKFVLSENQEKSQYRSMIKGNVIAEGLNLSAQKIISLNLNAIKPQ